MSADAFDEFKRKFEQAPSWAGATPNPIKASNGTRDVEAELDVPVVFVASEFEWKLPKPVGQDPAVTAAKAAAKAAKATAKPRKSPKKPAAGNGAAQEPWLCDPIAIEDAYRISAATGGASPVVPEPVSCLDMALTYATQLDWFVFASPPNTEAKMGYLSEEKTGAKWGMTKNPDEIREDWKWHPEANVAIPTGPVNRIWVLETDTAKGHPNLEKLGTDGAAELAKLTAIHGTLPETLSAVSPSGSIHHYYRNRPTSFSRSRTVRATSPRASTPAAGAGWCSPRPASAAADNTGGSIGERRSPRHRNGCSSSRPGLTVAEAQQAATLPPPSPPTTAWGSPRRFWRRSPKVKGVVLNRCRRSRWCVRRSWRSRTQGSTRKNGAVWECASTPRPAAATRG
jgi:hypothetical protein